MNVFLSILIYPSAYFPVTRNTEKTPLLFVFSSTPDHSGVFCTADGSVRKTLYSLIRCSISPPTISEGQRVFDSSARNFARLATPKSFSSVSVYCADLPLSLLCIILITLAPFAFVFFFLLLSHFLPGNIWKTEADFCEENNLRSVELIREDIASSPAQNEESSSRCGGKLLQN